MSVSSLLIVDDNPEFCASCATLLAGAGFCVVGCAATGAAGVSRPARDRHPDVVLVDVQLPDIDGMEMARRLTRLDPAPAVILTSSRTAASYGPALLAAPGRGLVESSTPRRVPCSTSSSIRPATLHPRSGRTPGSASRPRITRVGRRARRAPCDGSRGTVRGRAW